MQFTTDITAEARTRLRRIEGQIAGIIRMLDDGRECRDVVQQIAAASKALDRTGFKLIAGQLRHCITDAGDDLDDQDLEKLFLSLA